MLHEYLETRKGVGQIVRPDPQVLALELLDNFDALHDIQRVINAAKLST